MRKWKVTIVFMLTTAFLISGCLGGANDPGTGGEDLNGDDGNDGANPDEGQNQTGEATQEISAGWLVGVSGCLNVVYLALTDGVDSHWDAVSAESQGQPFNATFTSAAPAVIYGISFGAGETLSESFDSMDGEIEGTVPSDAENVIFWSCLGVEVSVDFTVTPGQ